MKINDTYVKLENLFLETKIIAWLIKEPVKNKVTILICKLISSSSYFNKVH